MSAPIVCRYEATGSYFALDPKGIPAPPEAQREWDLLKYATSPSSAMHAVPAF
ncbi:MAG TPA: hypothetical protein VGD63_00130 [Steroidobacteraceae bacterium]